MQGQMRLRNALQASAFALLSQKAVTVLPNGYAWGCLNISRHLPFCDPTLGAEQRARDLVSRLSLEEKILFLGPDTTNTRVATCDCLDGGNARLGIPRYMNLVEANSAVASNCLEADKCSTAFPGPTGLAASFNRSAWRRKGEVISNEVRAFNNLNWYRGIEQPDSLIGLSAFGPNINIERDPRFGRNSELPGEDPVLSGLYALEYVKGMQEGEDRRYLKMIAGLKHFAGYSVEEGRSWRMFNISQRDLWDTYLKQYKYGFHASMGNAGAAMCSYAGVNGVPACAHSYLLNEVVRKHWGRPDAVIVSDCGAIANQDRWSNYTKSYVESATTALLGGTDIDLGDRRYSLKAVGGDGALYNATKAGMVPEAAIDLAVERVMANRIRTGLFDPLEGQVYTTLGAEAVNASWSHDMVLDMTLQSLVLLKNDGLLPLKRGTKVAVLGPHVDSQRDLFEDYPGDQICLNGTWECVQTIGALFTRMNGEANTRVAWGVELDSRNASGVAEALTAAASAEVVLLFLGTGNKQEHEGMDRNHTRLPGIQEEFAQQVLALGKPTVLVLINGGILSIDSLIKPTSAIIEAFNPALRGAEALFLSIFGMANRWGRLPVTVYPADYASQVDMNSFDMTAPPGRTYRYYQGTPLFPFGHGLTYSHFELSCQAGRTGRLRSLTRLSGEDVIADVVCSVRNTAKRDGDEVLMVFHSAGEDIQAQVTAHSFPIRSLVAFERVAVGAGGSGVVTFGLRAEDLRVTDEQGDQVLYCGEHKLQVFDGVSWSKPMYVVVQAPVFKTVLEAVPKP